MSDLAAFLWEALTNISASTITAAAAVTIAFSNGYATRKHYRLSVRPKLKITRKFRGVTDHSGYGIKLLNVGLGPAVINDIAITVDGNIVDNSHSSLKKVLETVGLNPSLWHLTGLQRGAVIRSGEEIKLFRTDELEKEPNSTILCLCRIAITIEYSSFYGERQPILNRSLASESLIIEGESLSRVELPATGKSLNN